MLSLGALCCCYPQRRKDSRYDHDEYLGVKNDNGDDDEIEPHTRPLVYRLGMLLFAIVQNGLLQGLVFGWASIDQTMLAAPIEDGGTNLTLHETTTIFTWSSSIGMASPLVLGIVLDFYGPRCCTIISCCIVMIGCQIFATSDNFHGFAFGICLIAFGGPGIMSSIVHISNLFPQYENFVMSCLAGSSALSFSIFTIFDLLWERHDWISYRTLFGSYVPIVAILAVASYYLYPDEPYDKYEEEDDNEESSDSEILPVNDSVWPQAAITTRDNGNRMEQNVENSTSLLLPKTRPDSNPLDISHQQPFEKTQNNIHQRHRRQDSHYHHHHHISATTQQPSLMIEQSLDSYLRSEDTIGPNRMQKSDSFRQSEWAWKSGAPQLMSMKDQPFYVQLFSAIYFRALLVFISTAYWSNFYVASISTEFADKQRFSMETQHDLARTFTLIISVGMIGSFAVGYLLDRVGLDWCTVITLFWGQLHMILLSTLARDNRTWMIISFWIYMLFRNFLYPVYIGSLTERLGFKYFGVLLGIGFGMSGLSQLSMTLLDETVQGSCHLQSDSQQQQQQHVASSSMSDSLSDVESDCDHGWWDQLHVIQCIQLGCLMICPYLDRWELQQRRAKLKEILGTPPTSSAYGSVPAT